MTAAEQTQASQYEYTTAALRDGHPLGVTIQDIGKALRNPLPVVPVRRTGGRCKTYVEIAKGRNIPMVVHRLGSRVEDAARV